MTIIREILSAFTFLLWIIGFLITLRYLINDRFKYNEWSWRDMAFWLGMVVVICGGMVCLLLNMIIFAPYLE